MKGQLTPEQIKERIDWWRNEEERHERRAAAYEVLKNANGVERSKRDAYYARREREWLEKKLV